MDERRKNIWNQMVNDGELNLMTETEILTDLIKKRDCSALYKFINQSFYLFRLVDILTVEDLQELISYGFNVNITSESNCNLLINACSLCYVEIVKVLIKNGANLDVQDKYGKTALMHAVTSYNDNISRYIIVKMLIEAGAGVDILDKFGRTPLMMSTYNEDIKVVQTLLEGGADPNITDNGGETALFYSVGKNGDPTITKMLIDSGADIHHKNKSGNTVFDINRFKYLLCHHRPIQTAKIISTVCEKDSIFMKYLGKDIMIDIMSKHFYNDLVLSRNIEYATRLINDLVKIKENKTYQENSKRVKN